MHVAILGASGDVGDRILSRLFTDPTLTATLLVRNPDAFLAKADGKVKALVAPAAGAGEARIWIVKGNARNEGDVLKLFHKQVDVLISVIARRPEHLYHGGSRGALALVNALVKVPYKPHVVALSSMGAGQNIKVLPIMWRILYPILLSKLLDDKYGMEYLLLGASSVLPTPSHPPTTSMLSKSDRTNAPFDFLPQLTIIRAAAFAETNEKGKQMQSGEKVAVYSVSKDEVADFVVLCAKGQWVNKAPVIGW